jgi:hypothetical protein
MRNVEIRLFIVILFIFTQAGQSFGQKKLFKGFIVLHAGDTVLGYVKKGKTSTLFSECNFQDTITKKIRLYLPYEIKSYGFEDGKSYESIKDERSGVFFLAEQVIVGAVSLLYNGDALYFKKGGVLTKLPKPYEKISYYNGTPIGKKFTPHTDTLRTLMGNCPEVSKYISKVFYSYSSFHDLFQKYNTCIGSPPQKFDKKLKAKIEYKILAGVTESHLRLTDYFPEYGDGNFSNSRKFTGGGGLNFSSPRLSEQLKVSIEALWISNFYHGRSKRISSTYTSYYEFFTDVSSLKVPIGLQYDLSKKAFSPFISGGVVTEFLIKKSANGTKEVESFGTVTTENITVHSFRKSVNGFWLALGVTKKISPKSSVLAQCRAEKSVGYFGPGANKFADVTSISVLLGLQF